VPHRLDLIARAEHTVQVVEAPSQFQQRVPCLSQAHRVILGHRERLCRRQLQVVLVLQGGDCRDVVGVVRVDQGTYGYQRVPRAGAVSVEVEGAGAVVHLVDEVVLVDHHDGDVTVSGVRHAQAPAAGKVDNGEAVEGVAVQPDDGLLIDRRRFAVVPERVDTSGAGLDVGQHASGLRPHEVVDVDTYCHGGSFARWEVGGMLLLCVARVFSCWGPQDPRCGVLASVGCRRADAVPSS